ncbi:FAD-dependent oxidoreductase [Paenibacillus roseipurpureus]|uniref:FAD-dependent oxidoreductase n=1 Tax=Paenibacillus roseopurpureus TaxID=2918901 RepID=A0AA96LPV5_9BACL|nr:FAD-dependent oxidoreductase [Paenibacillus sp. MBLB1832]WNR46067.1 FAD-dependent oxidoreductase [Paenibacillus sp. MBLB1832]
MLLSRKVNGVLTQVPPAEDSFFETYDVIVVGLGTAGAAAVISAARKGLKVLGIERLTCMGGTGTAGGVLGYYFGSRGGEMESLDTKVAAMEKLAYTPSSGVNGEVKKLLLEQAALEAGATLSYDSTLTGVWAEGSVVRGIQWISPRGILNATASFVIDATGEGDVCRMLSCEFRGGREFDGQAQPFSNVLIKLENGRIHFVYTDSGYVVPHDPQSMSQAIVSSAILSTHLQAQYGEEQRILKVAPLLGVREGQFIVGEENVTFDKFMREDYDDKPIFFAYSNADNHSKDVAFESELQQDWTVASSLWGYNFTVPVPLGALIPKGFGGLMVAGRCLAVDHDMASCIRMKRDMQKSGEAAANAVYLAIKHNVSVRDVPYSELAELLMDTGCLKRDERVAFKETLSHADETNPLVKWLTAEDDIKAGLASDKPGVAIWSAKRLGDHVKNKLIAWVKQDTDHQLQRHSALSLGLIGDHHAAPLLRQMVVERDPYVPKTSRKYNQARGYAAIYLLGKMRDKEILPQLIQILEERGENLRFMDANREFISDETELYFQYASYSLVAMTKIGQAHPETRSLIYEVFNRFISRLDGSLIISFKGSSAIKFIMDTKVREWIRQAFIQWGCAV